MSILEHFVSCSLNRTSAGGSRAPPPIVMPHAWDSWRCYCLSEETCYSLYISLSPCKATSLTYVKVVFWKYKIFSSSANYFCESSFVSIYFTFSWKTKQKSEITPVYFSASKTVITVSSLYGGLLQI